MCRKLGDIHLSDKDFQDQLVNNGFIWNKSLKAWEKSLRDCSLYASINNNGLWMGCYHLPVHQWINAYLSDEMLEKPFTFDGYYHEDFLPSDIIKTPPPLALLDKLSSLSFLAQWINSNIEAPHPWCTSYYERSLKGIFLASNQSFFHFQEVAARYRNSLVRKTFKPETIENLDHLKDTLLQN